MSVSLPQNPLSRTIAHFRDDHKVVIACDDTYAPYQYFSPVELPRTEIVVIPAEDRRSYITYVLDRLLEEPREEDDELWIVLDTDHCICPNHVGNFSSEIGRAERNKVNVALSRPCFEYWLALYHMDPDGLEDIGDAKELERKLGEAVAVYRSNATGYSKTNVQSSDYPVSLLPVAMRRAERRDSLVLGGRIPEANTTRVHKLWMSVLCRFEEFQIPDEYLDAYRVAKDLQV